MIICILEYPDDDQAQVWFMDTTKLDMTETVHSAYKKAVDEALADDMNMSAVNHDTAFFYNGHNDLKSCQVDPPCHVDEDVTIYVE